MSWEVTIPLAGAVAAILAAVIAGRYALTTQRAAQAEQRALELEKRLASIKEEVYRPMINLIQKVLDGVKGGPPVSDKELQRTVSDFMTWAQVFAADEVVIAADRWMKSATAAAEENATQPIAGTIAMYYIGRFVLELRKDLGQADTRLTVRDLLALRITDIYDSAASRLLTMPEDEFLEAVGWTPPWTR